MTRADSTICFKECRKIASDSGGSIVFDEWLCPLIIYPLNRGMCRLRTGDVVPDACPFGSCNSNRSREIKPDGSCFTG